MGKTKIKESTKKILNFFDEYKCQRYAKKC